MPRSNARRLLPSEIARETRDSVLATLDLLRLEGLNYLGNAEGLETAFKPYQERVFTAALGEACPKLRHLMK